uniref:Uncharacterized protein n=1 Tax=Wuchereria bancrofti TaxID=6293 RepID=A0AAF5RWR7_WUCBA
MHKMFVGEDHQEFNYPSDNMCLHLNS